MAIDRVSLFALDHRPIHDWVHTHVREKSRIRHFVSLQRDVDVPVWGDEGSQRIWPIDPIKAGDRPASTE